METSNKKNQFVWAQTVTVYGSKLTLHTTNFKKSWGLKFYEAFRYGKGLKLQAVNSKLPAMIKLFIGCEIITLIYSKFIKDRITITNSANSSDDIYEKNNSVISIHQKISKNFIYKFFEKENFSDYIANILIYSLFGKYFYFSNRKLTYSIFAIGGLSSIIFYKLNNIAKNFAQKKMKIQDLNLYSTQFNLIPKIFLTTSILSLFNYFFKENFYMIKNKIPMNHKMIYVYFWAYILSKVSRPISNVTHESLK